MKKLALAIFLALPLAATAQDDLLPDYAYDALAEISAITTAGQTCDGAKVNDRRLQTAMVDLMGKLAADGHNPVASVQSLESDTGKAQMATRETELRARHGVAPEGADALCDAIRVEVKTNKAMAKILKLR
ncbi:MAG: DUF5333 family protein [Paracoccaceae bacterium]